MIGIIYYQSWDKGLEHFKEVLKAYDNIGVHPTSLNSLKYSLNNCSVKLDNGDYWRTIRCGDNARGYRWDNAHIENSISTDDIYKYILPYGPNHNYITYY